MRGREGGGVREDLFLSPLLLFFFFFTSGVKGHICLVVVVVFAIIVRILVVVFLDPRHRLGHVKLVAHCLRTEPLLKLPTPQNGKYVERRFRSDLRQCAQSGSNVCFRFRFRSDTSFLTQCARTFRDPCGGVLR